jgi:hypothetical protein
VNESFIYIQQTIALINHYNFDLEDYTVRELIVKWSKKHKHFWLPLAVIEAIYQGRLKAISVEQILNLWEHRSQPIYHFNSEFKQLITAKIFTELKELSNLNGNVIELKDQGNNHHVNPSEDTLEQREDFQFFDNSKSSISQFQPLDDYSTCYLKLKDLANNNYSILDNYDDFFIEQTNEEFY